MKGRQAVPQGPDSDDSKRHGDEMHRGRGSADPRAVLGARGSAGLKGPGSLVLPDREASHDNMDGNQELLEEQ